LVGGAGGGSTPSSVRYVFSAPRRVTSWAATEPAPANKPTIAERNTCRPWLLRELALLWPSLRVVVVLGGFGWTSLWPTLRAIGVPLPAKLPVFGHGAEATVDGRTVLGCYHVSQQNTFTGRLTEPMLDAIFARAAELAELC
jgi:uracil-DNA glycosylase